ncbi:MAG: 30S ribosomal protein S17 [Acidobacteriota bacterium]|nr:30S ribosomal protein S17 [Acidobacteriota bacterium]
MESEKTGRRNAKVGIVKSDGMDKTVVVSVERRVPHPLYRRIVTRTSKFLAHDEQNACGVGDRVAIVETRPASKRKRWRVSRIITKAS